MAITSLMAVSGLIFASIAEAQTLGWLLPIAACIGIWTVELSWVQAITLAPPLKDRKKFALLALAIRTSIDLCFITALMFALPRFAITAICVLAFFVHVGLLMHFRHLHRPLSLLVLIHNWREGVALWPRSSALLFTRATWWLLASLTAKLAILWTAPQMNLSAETRFAVVATAAVGFLSLLAAASFLDPLNGIRGSRGLGRLGMIRGYFPTWLGEMYYCGGNDTREHAIAQRHIVQDRLTPLETPIPIREHLVIIQAESLDYNVLGLNANGQEVVPFLNQLRKASLFYRLAGARFVGSADVDFTILSGVMPSTRVVNYKIPNYPYDDALPAFLAPLGFRTSMFHGYAGRFYDRRVAYSRMGFAEMHFQEDWCASSICRQIRPLSTIATCSRFRQRSCRQTPPRGFAISSSR